VGLLCLLVLLLLLLVLLLLLSILQLGLFLDRLEERRRVIVQVRVFIYKKPEGVNTQTIQRLKYTNCCVPISHCGPLSALAVINIEFHSDALSYTPKDEEKEQSPQRKNKRWLG
jgi:hypothetical protein